MPTSRRETHKVHSPQEVEGHQALEELAHRVRDLEHRLSVLEAVKPTEEKVGGDIAGRVSALEKWRHALRHHTHQFLSDTGWEEPR